MKTKIVEKDWITKSGLRAVVLLLGSMSHRCGYVEVPKEHPLYKKNYDAFEVNVHGGITYGGVGILGEDVWCIGFDAMHYNDAPDWDAGEQLIENDEDREVFNQIKEIMDIGSGGTIRTLKYMADECEDLATQIMEGL